MYIVRCFADGVNEWNCSNWRDLKPADAINRTEEHRAKLIHASGFIDYLNPSIQDLVSPADIIIVQRNIIDEQMINAMLYWKGMGKTIAVDLDDAYHILPHSNMAKNFWHRRQNGEALKVLESGLSLADGLIAPNRLLLYDWAHVAKGYYLQNFSEPKYWADLKDRSTLKKEKELENKIIIGWGGSLSHYDSFWGSGIFEAAKRIAERYPNVVFMICGNDRRVYENLNVSDNQKYYQEGVPPHEWPQIIKMFDIGVAPLFGPYDQRRSWIKGLEYMLAGVPWIATRGEVYGDFEQLGLGTIVSNSVNEWENAIARMIDNLSAEQNAANERISLAEQWHTDNQVENMIATFQKIINDRNDDIGVLPNAYRVIADTSEIQPNVQNQTEQVQVEQVDEPANTIPELDPKALNEIQEQHLEWLESWAQKHTFEGVEILKPLNYNLIQILNNEYLQDVL